MLSRIEHGAPIKMLMAWDPKDDPQLGSIWRALVEELAASTNSGPRLDAGFLRLTEAAAGPELEASARQMFDLVLAERATVEQCAEQFDYRARTLSYLRFHCRDAIAPATALTPPPLPEHLRIMEQWIPEFERQWEASKPKAATHTNPPSSASVTSRLASNTAPADLRRRGQFTPTDPSTWTNSRTVIGPDGRTNMIRWANGIPPPWARARPGLPRGPGLPADAQPPTVNEVLAEEWVVEGFWSPRVPDELAAVLQTNVLFGGGVPDPRTRGNVFLFRGLTAFGAKWRDGKIWVAAVTSGRRSEDRGFLCAVDPKTLATQSFALPWSWSWELKPASDEPAFDRCAFDVVGNHIYAAAPGQVKRFDTRDRSWTDVAAPLQEVGRVTALGDRVFVTSNDSILEIDPDSLEVTVLASSRRRPALNLLDELDRLRFPLVWLAGDRLRALIQPWVYEHSPASHQWEKIVYFEPYHGEGDVRGSEWPVQAFADGILLHHLAGAGSRRMLGLFGESRTPEVLLTDYLYNPGSMRMPQDSWNRSSPPTARTNETRWWGPPQSKLVGGSASFDGTTLWCLFSTNRSAFGGDWVSLPGVGEHLALRLTRFTGGVASPLTIPLKLHWQPSPELARIQPRGGPRSGQIELQPTPAGLVVVAKSLGGFWWLPKDELVNRLAPANTGGSAANPAPASAR